MLPFKNPLIAKCTKCSWKSNILQYSDCILAERYCPKCNTETTLVEATIYDKLKCKIIRKLMQKG